MKNEPENTMSLKMREPHFSQVSNGKSLSTVRLNDRNYKVGLAIRFQLVSDKGVEDAYTNWFEITNVLDISFVIHSKNIVLIDFKPFPF